MNQPPLYIGCTMEQKRDVLLSRFNSWYDADRLFVFYGGRNLPYFDFPNIDTVYIPWSETKMYRTFYPLLGQPYSDADDIPEITEKSIVVIDEMLMVSKRNDLRYHCTAHFLNRASRRVVFNYLPFIECSDDFMILMDYAYPGEYKGKDFHADFTENAVVINRGINFDTEDVPCRDSDMEGYEQERDKLMQGLGSKNFDTVPQKLILRAGRIKMRSALHTNIYLTRDSKYKKKYDFAYTYGDIVPGSRIHMVEPPVRRKALTDFLARNMIESITYPLTRLSVDGLYMQDVKGWTERLGEFYAEADIHRRGCT